MNASCRVLGVRESRSTDHSPWNASNCALPQDSRIRQGSTIRAQGQYIDEVHETALNMACTREEYERRDANKRVALHSFKVEASRQRLYTALGRRETKLGKSKQQSRRSLTDCSELKKKR